MNEEGTDQTQGSENHDDNDVVKIRSIITQHGGFETHEQADRRKAVFEKLQSLIHSFMLTARTDHLSKQRGKHPEMHIPEPESNEPPGRLLSFGSYRLDVCGKDADIDTLCVAPSFVTRCDFFYKFGEMLKKLPNVSDYLAIPLSFVPVLKMKYDQIEVDILFANLSLESIPEDLQIHNDELLRDMEVRCVRSLNGCRNTDEILNSVKNLEVFRLTLRVIKIWAKRRGVYSNMLGYLGGFACAMLVAKAAKMNPNADVPTLIHKFFTIFSKWHWPEPVLLKTMYTLDMTFTVWNPEIWNHHDPNLMPIITPAYPQQNSTHNVTKSSFKVIKEEFERGLTVTNEIINHTEDWAKLFDEPPFFSSYTRYCVLTATAESQETFKKWTGLVVSKIRVLIASLDRNPDVDVAHINDQTFTKLVETSEGKIIYTQHWFVGIQYEKTTQLINLFITEQQLFRALVNQQCKNQKIYSPDMEIHTKVISPKELTQYLTREELHLPPGDGEHGNTNGFMSDEGRRKVESSMKINDIKHHQPTSNNNNINGGMGDSSSFADHKPNRNTKSVADSHVAGQKRKSPTSFMDNYHNQLQFGGLYNRLIEPPSKFRITGKSTALKLFHEPPPPGTEPLPPGTESLHPPSPATSDIGYFDGAMSAAPIAVVNGHTKQHISMNGGSGGTLVGFHSFGGSVNYATPIPVIGSRKIHVISSTSSPTSGFASSPIPTVMTNNRWTREPQHPQCMDIDQMPSRCRSARLISVVSSTQPSSEDLYYDSMMSSDSSPPSTSYHHHHHHNNHITTSFSSIQAAHYNNSMSPQAATAPIDDPPPPSSRTTPSSSKQRIVTCKRRSSERKQTKEQTSSSRRHHHHSKQSVHRRHESSRVSSGRSQHDQHSRSFHNDSPEYEHRRTRRKKRSSTSSHNSVMIRSRNSF